MSDLSLIPSDELIQELVNRHDHLVITAVKYKDSVNHTYVVLRRWHGDRYVCSGLTQMLQAFMADEERQSSKLIRGEDV